MLFSQLLSQRVDKCLLSGQIACLPRLPKLQPDTINSRHSLCAIGLAGEQRRNELFGVRGVICRQQTFGGTQSLSDHRTLAQTGLRTQLR